VPQAELETQIKDALSGGTLTLMEIRAKTALRRTHIARTAFLEAMSSLINAGVVTDEEWYSSSLFSLVAPPPLG